MDREFVREALRAYSFERIVFAAGPADVQQSFADPVADFRQQALPLLNVLEESRLLSRPPGVLLVSSAAVYGNPAANPVSEETLARPISPYGFHKLHQEMLLDEYAALYNLPTAKARVFSTFGPGLRHLAVWDITNRALRGQNQLWGTGGESRDYLHVIDVASALEHVARTSAFKGEVVNIASGRETAIAQLAAIIFDEMGLTAPPVFDGSQLSGSPARWRADVSRLADLGFAPQVALERGLRETVRWIRQHA